MLDRRITLRLPEEVRAKYESMAEEANLSISALLRFLLSEDKKITIQRIDDETRAERARLLRMLANAGNNINQIARHLNILAKKDELDYGRAIHFLRMLDTIEARISIFLEVYENAHPH